MASRLRADGALKSEKTVPAAPGSTVFALKGVAEAVGLKGLSTVAGSAGVAGAPNNLAPVVVLPPKREGTSDADAGGADAGVAAAPKRPSPAGRDAGVNAALKGCTPVCAGAPKMHDFTGAPKMLDAAGAPNIVANDRTACPPPLDTGRSHKNSGLTVNCRSSTLRFLFLFAFGHLFLNVTNVFCDKKRVGHACICPRMVTG